MICCGPLRHLAFPVAMVVALAAAACDTGRINSPAPTSISVPSVSLIPATETSTPEPVETPGEPPLIGPPSDVPPPPPDVTLDYQQPADDLSAFVAAYREAFQVSELSDQQIADAGARLCTYLKRQAGPDGAVDANRALTEAEINEPGYPREVWVLAFEIATASYCREFSFDLDGEG